MTTYIGCSWHAVSNDSFLTIVSGSLSLSSGTCTVQADTNSSGMTRVGTVSFYRGSSGGSSLAATLTITQTYHDPNVYNIDDYATFVASLPDAFDHGSSGNEQWTGQLITNGSGGWYYNWHVNSANVVFGTPTYYGFSVNRAGLVYGAAILYFGAGQWNLQIYGAFDINNVDAFTGHKIGGASPVGVYTKDSGNSSLSTLTII